MKVYSQINPKEQHKYSKYYVALVSNEEILGDTEELTIDSEEENEMMERALQRLKDIRP